jgi:hypothetical protein
VRRSRSSTVLHYTGKERLYYMPAIKAFTKGGYTYELLLRNCGKKNCGKCPHGPYWYMSFTLRTGRKVRKYVGKDLPEGVKPPRDAAPGEG